MNNLCVSIRFLMPFYHGSTDAVPDWPPSPLRVLQALVATAGRLHPTGIPEDASSALQWLAELPPPLIIAPSAAIGIGYNTSVPNNTRDAAVTAWTKGNDNALAAHRTMKRVRPVMLDVSHRALIDDAAVLRYVWNIADGADTRDLVRELSRIASGMVALGWGSDLVVGDAQVVGVDALASFDGERWLPTGGGVGKSVKTPTSDTLSALRSRHQRFLGRVRADGRFDPPPPLTAFRRVAYRHELDPEEARYAVFALKPIALDARGFRSFDVARQALTVAGMLRHTVKRVAEAALWSEEEIAKWVLGHGEASGTAYMAPGGPRLSYIPLPSIQRYGALSRVGPVNRALISTGSPKLFSRLESLAGILAGEMLIDAKTTKPTALLEPIDRDSVVARYTTAASVWESVTPVILPGFDDPRGYTRTDKSGTRSIGRGQLEKLRRRADSLIRKAMVHAGIPEALAKLADIQLRKSGFWPGTDLVDRYGVPDHLQRFPRYHVRIEWRDAQGRAMPVRGPLCIGSGRFYGIGLFASVPV